MSSTLYTRQLTAESITLLQKQLGTLPMLDPQAASAQAALQLSPDWRTVWPLIRSTWETRVQTLQLKGKTKDTQAAAYLQGVLAALTATGFMPLVTADRIAFLVSVGRWKEVLGPDFGKMPD